jgi:cellulose synthase/poly-beta-1,6-N-acetylglucosamine synthase-like glycosyltransferase
LIEVAWWVFWMSAALLLYGAIGYPVLIAAACLVRGKRVYSGDESEALPSTSVIIAAHNESADIADRLRNVVDSCPLSLDYEVVVGSDGSTDGTVAEAQAFPGGRVRVLHFPEQRGRAAIHNEAVQVARGDVLVFTDAGTRFEQGTIELLLRHFASPQVGCVVGRLRYRAAGSAVSHLEALFRSYEDRIRNMESCLGLLAMGSGAIMAVRRELYRQLEARHDVDNVTPVDVVLSGSRVLFEPCAIAWDVAPRSTRGEFRARARMTAQAVDSLLYRQPLRTWVRHPAVLLSVLSHRGLRYLSPYLVAAIFVANARLLSVQPVYAYTAAAGVLSVALALYGLLRRGTGGLIWTVGHYFGGAYAALAGLAVGVGIGLRGRAPERYRQRD